MHGDALVLSSGALHELLDDDEIADALRASASSEDVTARLLAIAGIRGDGAGTVIVGRAFHEAGRRVVVPPPAGARGDVRAGGDAGGDDHRDRAAAHDVHAG